MISIQSKKFKIILFALFIGLIWAGPIQAQSKVGTSSMSFLGIGAGPKALSMGGAYVAFSDGASAVYWNPGATAQLNTTAVTFSHTDYFVDTDIIHGSGVIKPNRANAIGFSFYSVNYGRQEVTTIAEQYGNGTYWEASDLALTLNYSRLLTDRFSLGGNFKYMHEKIWETSASAFAVDVGLLFKTQLPGLKLGMSISNYGKDIKFSGSSLYERIDIDPDNGGHNENITSELKTEQWPIPLYFRTGLSYNFNISKQNEITLATDAVVPSDNEEHLNFGAEWKLFDVLSVRAGYRSLGYSDSQEGLTLGGGIEHNLINQFNNLKVRIDYSYQTYEYFNNVQTFGVELIY